MDEILVRVQDLHKKFSKDFKKSLWYGALDILRDLVGIKQSEKLRKTEFWVLKNINFELKRGECLGLIGQNGAGKSTLLKMLNGLILPDKGEIEMKGRVCALIELGAGFNPVLTGRENVFNYGSVLGFSHQEILEMYRDIVEFAELQGFMETPVQNYSSGMKVRLGFAVAAQMKPDVLIIDEVLAVGDVNFRAKCLDRINHLLQNAAVILVSHQMGHIARMCNSILTLNKGKIDYLGDDVDLGIRRYLDTQETSFISQNFSNGITIRSCDVHVSEQLTLDLEFIFDDLEFDEYFVHLLFNNEDQKPSAIFQSSRKVSLIRKGKMSRHRAIIDNQFTNGNYLVSAKLYKRINEQIQIHSSFSNIARFKIEDSVGNSSFDIQLNGSYSEIS